LSHHHKVASFFSIWSYDVLYHAGKSTTWYFTGYCVAARHQQCFNHQPVIKGLGRFIVS